jgi:hypothetical protein
VLGVLGEPHGGLLGGHALLRGTSRPLDFVPLRAITQAPATAAAERTSLTKLGRFYFVTESSSLLCKQRLSIAK